MNTKRWFSIRCYLLLAAAVVLLVWSLGCAEAPTAGPGPTATATPAPTATATSAPTATPLPTATATSAPTATPLPTATPAPTATATPTCEQRFLAGGPDADLNAYAECEGIDLTILPTATPTPKPRHTGGLFVWCIEADEAGIERVQGSVGDGRGYPAELFRADTEDRDGDGVVCER